MPSSCCSVKASGSRRTPTPRVCGLIGDLPFFVSPDSSDVWANPELFLLDEQRRPRFVAGVPPDYFSAQGQLWGNPVYNWDTLRAAGYRWCIDRLRALLAHVDVIRLDHFRAFRGGVARTRGCANRTDGEVGAWSRRRFLSSGAARTGRSAVYRRRSGMITPDVYALRDRFQLPGTRVLQFAFDGDPENPHLPHNYVANTVAYTGTHDNPTTRGWFEELPEDQRQNLWKYLRRPAARVARLRRR